MPNYTIEELEKAYNDGSKSSYTKDEQAWYYNLYNRVFNQNKQPGCGKCFMNVRKQLSLRYKAEAGI
jgi:hypothetical protein